jgi:DNA-binding response OmpR family regulator
VNESNRPVTILIADDDPDVLELVRLSLRRLQHELVLAHDGAEALETVRRVRPELAILDVTMPEMDGFEVLEAIRADPIVSSTRIFMLTARARQAEKERGLTLGAERYISKPFKPRELRAQVDAALGRSAPSGHPPDQRR